MVKATKSGTFKAVKLPEPQVTVARCYSIIDIGTVPNIFKGTLQGMVHRLFITWELPKLKAVFNEEKGEQPFVVSEEFTLSTKNNSNLAKLVSAWRNKPFTKEEEILWDPMVMLGKTALIQLMHRRKRDYVEQNITEITNENTVLVMQSIMKRPSDTEAPAQVNPEMKWDWEAIELGSETFSREKFELIPPFIQKKLMESDEFKKYGAQHMSVGGEAPQPAAQTEPAGDNKVSGDEW